jgi:hypothetical protein
MRVMAMMVSSTSKDIARYQRSNQNKATENFLETGHINPLLVKSLTIGASVWLTMKSQIFTLELLNINSNS